MGSFKPFFDFVLKVSADVGLRHMNTSTLPWHAASHLRSVHRNLKGNSTILHIIVSWGNTTTTTAFMKKKKL